MRYSSRRRTPAYVVEKRVHGPRSHGQFGSSADFGVPLKPPGGAVTQIHEVPESCTLGIEDGGRCT